MAHFQEVSIVRIVITSAAFEAIPATLPLGSVGYEPKLNAKGERLIWLEAAVVDRKSLPPPRLTRPWRPQDERLVEREQAGARREVWMLGGQ